MVTPGRALRDGMAAALARDFDGAYALLQQATTESPGDLRAWLWRAVASPSVTDAIACLRRVLVYDPSHEQAQQALARLLVAQASAVATSGQAANALALAREATRLAPDLDAVWVGLAAVSDSPEARLEALRRAAELNPQAPKTRMLLCDALLHCGITVAGTNPDRARQLFRESAAIDPTDVRPWQALARIATRASEALEPLRELVRIAPDRPGTHAALKKALAVDAESLAASGSMPDAAARWREAAALDDRFAAAWIGLAATTTDCDEARRALESARRAGSTDPQIGVLWTRWQLGAEPPPASRPAVPAVEPARHPVQPHPAVTAPASQPAPPAVVAAPALAAAPVAAPPPVAAPAPVAPAPVAAPAAAPATRAGVGPAHPPAAPAVRGPKRTVLVVDDSPTVRKILSLTLERAGYGVLSAPDGESALATLQEAVPDLILLDISMPKLDGYEVCKAIRASTRTAHVPVVMLSGKDAFFDKVKGRLAGATEYLTKPFATPAVLAVIGRQFETEAGAAHG